MSQVSVPVRNALAYAVPELFWGMTWALTIDGPMVAAYRDAFGGSEDFVGLAWLCGSLALGVPGLFSAYWVEPLRHKRGFVFWGHLAGGLAMLLTAGGVHLFASQGAAAASAVYLVGVTLFFLTVGVLLPGWLALVGELFAPGTQSRVLGVIFVCNKFAAMVAGHFIAREVLAGAWSPTDQWTALFAVAGGAGVVGSFPFLWVVETPRPRPTRGTLGAYLGSLGRALRELPALRRFIAADVVGITSILTLAWYADAAIQGDGFHRSWAGHWVMVGAFTQVLMTSVVAWAAGRVLPRTWFIWGSLGGVFAAIAAAIGGELLAYDAAAVGLGIYMGVRVSCHAPMVMRLAPDRDGTGPIGLAVAAVMLVQGFGPPIGAWVVRHAGYMPVFATVAGCGVVSAILLLLWVPSDVPRAAASHATGPQA